MSRCAHPPNMCPAPSSCLHNGQLMSCARWTCVRFRRLISLTGWDRCNFCVHSRLVSDYKGLQYECEYRGLQPYAVLQIVGQQLVGTG